jgi:predicted permease
MPTIWSETLVQDLKFALRTLRRSPAFTAIAILSLALGIGANSTIFTFLNAIVLRPLPYPDATRIVAIQERPLKRDGTVGVHPYNFLQWRQRATSFDALALAQMLPFNTNGPDGAEQVSAMLTTTELFRVFGVTPSLGRAFTPQDAHRFGTEDPNRRIIVSYEFWQRRLGADPAAIGTSLIVNNVANEIIGVAPPGFRIGTLAPDLYVPMWIDPAKPDSIGSRSFLCFGRLRTGTVAANITVASARAELDTIAAQLSRETPIDKEMGVALFGMHDYLVQSSRYVLTLLMGVVALVLLIACLNLASLLLTRGIARQGELAIRISLGASRVRLVRQLLIESLVLAIGGGVAGLLLAKGAVRALLVLTSTALTFGRAEPITLDWQVTLFTIALSTCASLLFGLLPAWNACRIDPQIALRDRGTGTTRATRRSHTRSVLVIAEVSLAVVLLIGAGLLLRTFSKMLQIDLGFQPSHVLTMGLFLSEGKDQKRAELIEQMLERIETIPGVSSASTIQFLPVAGGTGGTGFRFVDRGEGAAPAQLTEVSEVSRGYLSTMGVPLLQGREFSAHDRMGSPRVAMVNRAFVRKYCADGQALGRTIDVQWTNEAPTEIVGVVGDVSYTALTTEARPMVYLLHAQAPGYVMYLVVRAMGEPAALATAVRHAVQTVDPTKSVARVKTMEQYVDEAIARPRLYASMVAAFAALALMLAGIGLYGLIAYAVTQRTHEIGIRMALGAERGAVLRMILTQGAALAASGLVLGVMTSLALGRLVVSLLFGVTATDVATYVWVSMVLAAVALLAAYIPARRASRVDPMVALRSE